MDRGAWNGRSRHPWRELVVRPVGISQTGVVVGASETAEGTLEVFLWTRSGGMRSLGSPGGNPEFLVANGVNTHRRVVGVTFPRGTRR